MITSDIEQNFEDEMAAKRDAWTVARRQASLVVVRQPCNAIRITKSPIEGVQIDWAGEEVCLEAATNGSCIMACPKTSDHPESMIASLVRSSPSGRVVKDRFGYKSASAHT